MSGIVPGANDVALFDGTLSSNFAFTLGGDLSWAGISLTNPSSAVSISGANILTLGYAGIDMSAATQNLSISSSLNLTSAQSWNVNTGTTLSVGPIAYLRFHGGLSKYYGRYSDEALLQWTDWIVDQARGGRPVWGYFNNDPEAHAIHDAQTLRAMVRQAAR